MIINSLKIANLRNIESADISLSPSTNIIHGDNGAGKTTLLEAIYYLARAKSFRPGSSRSPITTGKQQLNIFSTATDKLNQSIRIGLEKNNSDLTVRINREPVRKLSILADLLPISLITPQSYRIIEEGPEYRRRLINWGVFHVEHSYNSVMAEFNRVASQRNKALRERGRDLKAWESSYVDKALKVSSLQQSYFQKLQPLIEETISEIPFLSQLEFSFNQGWSENDSLSDVIERMRQQDIERGFTYAGPQRSDLDIKVDGHIARNHLSRGQMKVLITAITVAQAKLLNRARGETPIMMIDDMPSELDSTSLDTVSALVSSLSGQILITAVDPNRLINYPWSEVPEVFHVEHGRFVQRRKPQV